MTSLRCKFWGWGCQTLSYWRGKQMSQRPGWDERMLLLAEGWAQYSTCKRRQVGAVLFDPETKAVISIGYNDTATGQVDCGDGGCERCDSDAIQVRDYLDCRCVHAEGNALALAAGRGVATKGAWLATTLNPCASCTKILIQAGVTTVVLGNSDEDEISVRPL